MVGGSKEWCQKLALKHDEFDYDRWYHSQILKLADTLIKALHLAQNIDEANGLFEPIKEKINSLGLPNQKCSRCGELIPYWDWAINQGYCEKCIKELCNKLKKEVEE